MQFNEYNELYFMNANSLWLFQYDKCNAMNSVWWMQCYELNLTNEMWQKQYDECNAML